MLLFPPCSRWIALILHTRRHADLEGFVNLAAALVNAHLEDTKEVEDSLVQLSAAASKAASGESSATLSARYSA